MELQQLKYFREVAEQQHVTRAAAKLFVSQSAVSRAIAQLEKELGVPLFYRNGRSISLSKFGQEFLPFVIKAQNHLENGFRAIQDQINPDTGVVACGFLGSLGSELVPRLIEAYRRRWPAVQFTLVQRSGEALTKLLLDGSVDLCLSVPGVFDHPTLKWSALKDEKLIVAVPQTHRLAARRTIKFRDLREDAFLALTSGRTLRVIFNDACASAGFSPRIAFEAMDITTLRGMVAAGLGVALLPPSSSAVKGSVEVRLAKPQLVRPIGIAWVEERYMPPCSVNFRNFTESFFREK